VWQGTKGRTGYWLRWWDETGRLLLACNEQDWWNNNLRAEQERLRTQNDWQRSYGQLGFRQKCEVLLLLRSGKDSSWV